MLLGSGGLWEVIKSQDGKFMSEISAITKAALLRSQRKLPRTKKIPEHEEEGPHQKPICQHLI